MFGFARKITVLRNAVRATAIVAVTAVFAATTPTTSDASQRSWMKVSVPTTPYVVRTDYGGSVQKRLTDIRALRIAQRRVEIRGNMCLSSCTMLLGLQNTCVHPKTTFGFHGPSRQGQPLSKPLFDHVSHIIASHYPPVIRTWYMRVARHTLTDMHTITGAELIKLGAAKPCDVTPVYATRSPHPQAHEAG